MKRARCCATTAIYEFDSEADDMFNVVATINSIDPEKEREPVSPPTPLSFPDPNVLGDTNCQQPWPPDFLKLFSETLRPSDLTTEHLQALNVELVLECSVDELLPLAADGKSYIPHLAADQADAGAPDANTSQIKEELSHKRTAFETRLAELRVDNDTAYLTLTRQLPNGIRSPRLAYMRKFWECVENMSRYWDASLDRYYEDDEESNRKGVKRIKLDKTDFQPSLVQAATLSNPDATSGLSLLPTPQLNPELKHEDDAGSTDTANTAKTSPPSTASIELRSRRHYKGRRTHSGKDMPDGFRVDMARAFVEGAIWPFKGCLDSPLRLPSVQFGKVKVPIRQHGTVYRQHPDREKARRRILQGPLLCVQARPEINFASEVDGRLDMLRELGCLLHLAQERHREGKTEVIPGKNAWYTNVPRFGGDHPSRYTKHDTEDSTIKPAQQPAGSAVKAKISDGRGKKQRSLHQQWAQLRCASKTWDPQTEYMAIGKDQASRHDEVSDHAFAQRVIVMTVTGLHAIFPQSPSINTQAHRARDIPRQPRNRHPGQQCRTWVAATAASALEMVRYLQLRAADRGISLPLGRDGVPHEG
jgi:hypothetical protein